MKTLKLFSMILALLAFSNFSGFAQEKSGNEKQVDEIRYILINNIEEARNLDNLVVTNYFDLRYNVAFSTSYWPKIKMDYAVKMPLDGSFYDQVELSKLRTVILPIGDHALQDKIDGISLMSLIKNLLANDCGVIIHGRKWLRKAFRDQPDAEVQDFLKNEMGIKSFTEKSLMNGNTFIPYYNMGRQGDPVAKGGTIHSNGIFDLGGGPATPTQYYRSIDIMEVDKNHPHAVSTNFLHFTEEQDVTKIVNENEIGVRSETNGSRIVMFTYCMDVEALIFHTASMNIIRDANIWIEENMLWPDPWLKTSSASLNFGGVPVGQSKTLEFRVINFGKKDLNLTDAYLDDFDVKPGQEGAYEITDGKVTSTVVIKPNEYHSIFIKFTPVDEDFHLGTSLIVGSDNAFNLTFGERAIDITGKGGKDQVQGARYRLNPSEILDFGSAKVGQPISAGVWVVSFGSVELQVDEVEITDMAGGSFTFLSTEDTKVPKVIDPQDSIKINFNFAGSAQGQTYIGKFKIRAQNAPQDERVQEITLRASTMGTGSKMEFSADKIIFNNTIPNEPKTGEIQLYTNDQSFVEISDISLTNDGGGVFSLPDAPYTYPVKFNVNSNIYKLRIMYSPTEYSQQHAGECTVTSNSSNVPIFKIALTGETIASVGDNEVNLEDAIFTINASPNPAIDKATIEYELNSSISKHVNMYIVDINGKKVLPIFNGNLNPGNSALPMNLSELPSGSYSVIAEIGGKAARLSIVVLK